MATRNENTNLTQLKEALEKRLALVKGDEGKGRVTYSSRDLESLFKRYGQIRAFYPGMARDLNFGTLKIKDIPFITDTSIPDHVQAEKAFNSAKSSQERENKRNVRVWPGKSRIERTPRQKLTEEEVKDFFKIHDQENAVFPGIAEALNKGVFKDNPHFIDINNPDPAQDDKVYEQGLAANKESGFQLPNNEESKAYLEKHDVYHNYAIENHNKGLVSSKEHAQDIKVANELNPGQNMADPEKAGFFSTPSKVVKLPVGEEEQRQAIKDMLSFMKTGEGEGVLQESLRGLQQQQPSPLESQLSSTMQGLVGPLAAEAMYTSSPGPQRIPFASELGQQQPQGMSDILSSLAGGAQQFAPQLTQGLGQLLQGAGEWFGQE